MPIEKTSDTGTKKSGNLAIGGSIVRRFSTFAISVNFIVLWVSITPAQSLTTSSPSHCQKLKAKLDYIESRLKDWANLGRYREENMKLLSRPDKDRRVVFMGDSITDFWDEPRSGGFFPGKPYINRGISGQTTAQMLIRFRQDVIGLKPTAVVILGGTNDIYGNTVPTTLSAVKDNLVSMSELAQAHGTYVILASLLPVSKYHNKGKQIDQTIYRPPELIRALNVWIKQYATNQGLTYLDYHTAVVDDRGMLKAELSDDDVHPNAKGYKIMAPLAEGAIRAALKKESAPRGRY